VLLKCSRCCYLAQNQTPRRRSALADFNRLIPAPNETYTSLLWLGDTSAVDEYFQKRKKQEDEAKKKNR